MTNPVEVMAKGMDDQFDPRVSGGTSATRARAALAALEAAGYVVVKQKPTIAMTNAGGWAVHDLEVFVCGRCDDVAVEAWRAMIAASGGE